MAANRRGEVASGRLLRFVVAATLLAGVIGRPAPARAAPCDGTATVPALVTVRTAGPEAFVVSVTDQSVLDQMIDICRGVLPDRIVLGTVVTGNGGYNRDPTGGGPWSWHLDPATIALAEVTIELCDGVPSYVESHLQSWIETVGTYCPWSSEIIAVDADVALAGDFDVDGDVDGNDAAFLGGCFTNSGGSCFEAGPACCRADTDGDADVDCVDWSVVEDDWTEPGAPPPTVPCGAAVPGLSGWSTVGLILLLMGAGSLAARGRTKRLVPAGRARGRRIRPLRPSPRRRCASR